MCINAILQRIISVIKIDITIISMKLVIISFPSCSCNGIRSRIDRHFVGKMRFCRQNTLRQTPNPPTHTIHLLSILQPHLQFMPTIATTVYHFHTYFRSGALSLKRCSIELFATTRFNPCHSSVRGVYIQAAESNRRLCASYLLLRDKNALLVVNPVIDQCRRTRIVGRPTLFKSQFDGCSIASIRFFWSYVVHTEGITIL